MIPPVPVCRFTVDEYHHMIKTGILTEDDRVELLEGWIVPKMPHNPPHTMTITLAQWALHSRLSGNWFLRVQLPVTTPDSEPEPDMSVVRGNPRDYPDRHPGPRDTGLVVEVADTSLGDDRSFKGPLYARAGFPVYWVVNLPEAQVEVYTDPSGPTAAPAYRRRQDYGAADTVPFVLDGREVGRIPVRELLP
jgi:Uma2 family endonuclease